MERGDLSEFVKNATQMMIFLPIENVGRKIIIGENQKRKILSKSQTKV